MKTVLTVVPYVLLGIGLWWGVRNLKRNQRRQRELLVVTTLPESEIQELGTEIFEYIQRQTDRFPCLVWLEPFWSKREDLTIGDRYQALKPLLEQKFLVVEDIENRGELRPFYTRSATAPPSTVALSQREWERMLKLPTVDMSNNIYNNGSNGTYLSAQSRTGDAHANAGAISAGLTTADFERLSAALRADAAGPDPAAAALAELLADEVDSVKDNPQASDAGRVLTKVERATAAVAALSATLDVLQQLKGLVPGV